MHVILNIDTATEQGIVAVSVNNAVIAERTNIKQKEHAGWVHLAIEEVLKESGYSLPEIAAVAVVGGPGSYTGVRVGMASAKGLSYALNIPLIQLNTLVLMTRAAITTTTVNNKEVLYCPMIDARRMEVFTAIYDHGLAELLAPCAMVLEKDSFSDWTGKNAIVFFGSGSEKWKSLASDNAFFSTAQYTSAELAWLSNAAFGKSAFANLAYAEPVYLKEFYTTAKQ
jgi:tRNA threonylcarbamoyladenosine biosynthesis protein TsaB